MLWTTSLKTEGPNYKKKVNSRSLVFRNLSTVVRTRGSISRSHSTHENYWFQFHLCPRLRVWQLEIKARIHLHKVVQDLHIFFALKGVDICNFADDKTPYVSNSNLKSELETLEHNFELDIPWFEMNYMKLNTDKCHLLISRNKTEQMWAKLDRDRVWESNDVKLLGITLGNNLKFDKHVSNICSKANRKLSALTRVGKFLPV